LTNPRWTAVVFWASAFRYAAALALVLAASSIVGPAAAHADTRKLDTHLLEKMRAASRDDNPVKIIVTVRPGARKGLLRRLEALGASVSDDFRTIEASAAYLRPSRLRRLAEDKDVVSISIDAPVTSAGISSTVTGAALRQAYSLRSTLGLRAAGPVGTTASFQQGVAGYAGALSGSISSLAPSTGIGTSSRVKIEDEGQAGARTGMLLRFEGLFGSGAGQIPVGSTITSASVRISHLSDGDNAASASLHRLLVAWDRQSTWDSMTTSGLGLQRDNVEAMASADASVSGLRTSGNKVFSGGSLTATVQAWANGAPNHGWVVWQNGADGWTIGSSQHSTSDYRPVVTITYRAPVATTALTGRGVTVAVIDSGVRPDGGMTMRVKTVRNFTSGSANPAASSPADGYGHGTHVAGLIGGDQREVEGVAPGVSYVDLVVLQGDGSGSTSHVIKALEWAVANRTAYGIDVVNLSLGHPIYEPAATDPLVQAVEAAVRSGIVVVASAGNIGRNKLTGVVGYAGVTSPGNAPSAITVGATRTFDTNTLTDDTVADFSSRGPTWYDAFVKPDVVAPGYRLLSAADPAQHLYSTMPTLRGPSYGGRAYLHLSGTSMAAGVVSGAVALVIEASRGAFGRAPSPNAIKAMIQHSAFPMAKADGSGAYDVLTQGVGSLNPLGAVALAQALDPTVAVGSNWVAGNIPLVTAIDGETISWGQNIVWGDTLLWGSALNTRQAAWSNNIVWGDNGDNIVWGDSDNIVWGDSLRDDNIVWGDSADDNIVWGESADDNIVWGDGVEWLDNIVWGDNLIWGTSEDNIVWGDTDDNIVWGDSDNIVWGESTVLSDDSAAEALSTVTPPPSSGVDTDAFDQPVDWN
jgi:serine protease AprX